MKYLRIGGLLCLILIIMAAVLSMGGLAQSPPDDGDGSDGDATSEGDADGDATSEGDADGDATSEGDADGDATSEGDADGDATSEGDADGDATSEEDADGDATSEGDADDGLLEDAPLDDAPLDDAPLDDAPLDDAPLDDAPLDDAPLDDAPLDDAPLDDAPLDNAPLDNAPLDDSVSSTVNETETDDTNETVEEDKTPTEVVEEPEDEDEDEELSTSDRIWREGKNPLDYNWTYQTFSGFFYDLDEDIGTESLKIHLSEDDRSVDEKRLIYRTEPKEIDFEFNDWDSYQVIGFMAEKFFAGYVGTNLDVVDDEISLLDEEELRKVLIDSDDEYTVTTGSVLPLEEGYELRIKEIDLDGNKVWFSLAQDGDEVDSKVITPGDVGDSTYNYEVDLSGEDLPLVMAHVSSVFAGAETSLVTIDGLFQISDSSTSVEADDKYGEMEIDTISSSGITMRNENSITLRKGKSTSLMGDVSFLVADNNTIRFAPFVKRTGSYEIRGTVVDLGEVDEFTWTPYNFEGFYYDIDEDVGTERLEATFTGDKIDDGDLEYETSPQNVDFEYSRWGSYDVVGFLAEKYFAGYTDDTDFTDEFSVIAEEELRKVLIDDDEEYTVRSGATFPLDEGYELRIKEVDLDGNKVFLSITKDGDEVDNKVVEPGSTVKSSTFAYDEEIGSEDVPIIAVHIQSVFRGREEDLATIDGIFQVSDEPAVIEEGERYGKMEIDSVTDDGITMENDDSISLGKGKTVTVMENLKFKVSDSSRKLVAPIVEIKGELKPMTLEIPEATVGSQVNIKVTSKGKPVSNSRISIDEDDLGATDGDGIFIYFPANPGAFDVGAKKQDYTDAKSIIVVKEIKEERELAVSAPSEVLKGESFVIKVIIGKDQRPVEDASVFFDETKIGTSNSQGTVSYAAESVGGYTIRAAKDDLEDGTRNIVVLTSVETTGIVMDEVTKAGKTIDIKVDLENSGTVSDTKPVELKVNGASVETKEVVVGPGETRTETFKYTVPEEPGTYTVEVDGVQRTLTVEEKSNTGMIMAILILIFAIGGAAYLYMTGKIPIKR